MNDAIDCEPRGEIRRSLALSALFFGGLLGGASLIPLDAGVYAQANVVVAGKRQAVQHREGGVITALYVREGQQVRRGEVLAQIASSDLLAVERAIASELLSLYAQRERLEAERAGSGAVSTPAEFVGLPPTDRAIADRALAAQRALFVARHEALATEREAWEERARGSTQLIDGFHEQIAASRRQSTLLNEELVGMRQIAARGFASLNRVRALERAEAALQGEAGALRAQLLQTRNSVSEARLTATGLHRKQMEEVEGAMRDLLVRVNELQPRLVAARDQLARSKVRATADGTVVGLSVFTVGGVIAPNQTLMEIVPAQRRLVVEARVAPDDADDLRIGQQTQVRFSGFHDRQLPILEGRLDRVSADRLTDERTGMPYFVTQVSLGPEAVATVERYRGAGALRPGIPAEVLVPLRKRSALGYLLGPLVEAAWRGGREA